jgi:hypothetical protein
MTYKNEIFWDEEKGELRSTIVQNVAPVFELNKALYNEHSAGNSWKGEWHHIASIPRVLVAELIRKGVNILNPDERDEKVIA